MLVTPDILAALTVGYQEMLTGALGNAPKGPNQLDPNELAMVVNSTKKSETYVWSGWPAAMQEWIDRRVRKDPRFYNQTIPNKKYQTTLDISREALEDDEFDLIKRQIEMLAYRINQWREKLLIDKLEAGFSTTTYDGQNFFSTTHSEGDSGPQSNTDSNPLTADNLQTAIEKQELLLDDQGEELGIFPNLVIAGPKNRKRLLNILQSEELIVTGLAATNAFTSQGNANVLKGYNLRGVISPRITGYHWFTAATQIPGVRPLVWQDRIKPQLQSVTNPNDDQVFETDVFKYGVRARAGVGYGLWHLATGHDASS